MSERCFSNPAGGTAGRFCCRISGDTVSSGFHISSTPTPFTFFPFTLETGNTSHTYVYVTLCIIVNECMRVCVCVCVCVCVSGSASFSRNHLLCVTHTNFPRYHFHSLTLEFSRIQFFSPGRETTEIFLEASYSEPEPEPEPDRCWVFKDDTDTNS